MKSILFLITLTAATPLHAQASSNTPANPVVATVKREWEQLATYIGRAAEQIPESDYAFRPAPGVRSFGQLIGHLAGSQFVTCASALGETPKGAEGDIEKAKTAKVDLITAFRASTDYCTRAYAQSDAASAGQTKLFGRDASRLSALVRNAVHDGEHYGNIVTYMRIKGMAPPSSQPAPMAPPAR